MIPNTRSWLLLLAVILVSACAASTSTQVVLEGGVRPLQAGHEAVVLFPAYRERADSGNADFIGCLKKNLEKQVADRVKIMDSAAFQDALFPWFEAQRAPSTIEEMNVLLARSLVTERIASLGVRYLVNIASAADSHGFPGMFCGAGYGGGGCLGVSWEDKTYRVQAVIWDVVRGVESGTLTTTTSGRSFGLAFGIPIIFVAYTEKDACEALSAELGHLLINATETGIISK